MAHEPIHVLLLAFPGLNTLDLNGPIEVLGSAALSSPRPFTVTVAAADEITEAAEKVLIKRHVAFSELLADKGSKLAKFDVLIVPGGPAANVHKVIDSGGGGLMNVIQGFVGVERRGGRERSVMSICTGAGFLGALGLLGGKTVTAHFAYLEQLRSICAAAASGADEKSREPTEVVRKRWVDGGQLRPNLRLVTSGGVSCGIDCVLWMLGELVGLEEARKVATFMDYDWKFGGIAVTEGEVV